MTAQKATAYSHTTFDEICSQNGWNDENIEDVKDKAFISIICTEDVQKHYLEEDEEHWFKKNHPNVLNLEFDDVSQDIEWDDFKAHAITDEQAKEIVDFIESNLGKEFYIHCRCGYSRSQAIKFFINEHYKGYEKAEDDDYGIPNKEVLRKLNHVLWEKQLFFFKI